MTDDTAPDWQEWLRRWDVMQTAYLPFREERFTVMFDAVEALVGDKFVAVDLASWSRSHQSATARALSACPQCGGGLRSSIACARARGAWHSGRSPALGRG